VGFIRALLIAQVLARHLLVVEGPPIRSRNFRFSGPLTVKHHGCRRILASSLLAEPHEPDLVIGRLLHFFDE